MNKSIAFVVSPVSLEDIYGGLAKVGAVSPPIQFLLLAAVVREHGYDPVIIDCAAKGFSYAQAVEEVRKASPSVIGLTAMTPHIMQTAKLAAALKEALPDVPILLGGPHITSAPVETLERFEHFDIGVLGSAEYSLPELLDAVAEGQALESIPGLVVRKDKQVRETGERRERIDLASLPVYAWDILDGFPEAYRPPLFGAQRQPAAPVITSRGCPGKCTYCFSGCHKTIATYPADYIFDMLVELKERYGVREFMIYDDNFMMYRKNLVALLNRLIDEDVDLSWSCNARVDVVDEEILDLMKRAGCWQISFGIESGNQDIIDSLKKKISKERIRKALELARAAGIRTVGYFMIGHFRETEDTIRETIDFACSIPLDDFRMSFFTPLPGTEAYLEAHKHGEFIDDWGRMTLFNPVFFPHGFDEGKLVRWQKKALRAFFFRPGPVLSYLKMVRNPKAFMSGVYNFARYIFS